MGSIGQGARRRERKYKGRRGEGGNKREGGGSGRTTRARGKKWAREDEEAKD